MEPGDDLPGEDIDNPDHDQSTPSSTTQVNSSNTKGANKHRDIRANLGFQQPPSKLEVGWRRTVRNFTPSWFAVNMGTGIVSVLLHNLPYNGRWLYWLSVVVFCLNLLLFVIFNIISILRYTLYPEIWGAMIKHPTQSLFLGAYSMGLGTIVNMVALVCVPAWGHPWATIALALWIYNIVVALAICLTVPFVVMKGRETSPLENLTALSLFPFVTTVVAAATGGLVAEVLPNPHHALWAVIISYVLWGTGIPFAMIIMVIYFQRLAVHKLPSREVIVSVFLPIGPLGQGGFGIMQLGRVAMKVFPETHAIHPLAGEFLYIMGFITALIMWGFGLVWLFFAVATIYNTKHFPFNMGWWGFTFPLGVYASSTILLGEELPSTVFKVIAMIFSISVVLLWLLVAAKTLEGALMGKIFFAPCLKDLEDKKGAAKTEKEKDTGKLV